MSTHLIPSPDEYDAAFLQARANAAELLRRVEEEVLALKQANVSEPQRALLESALQRLRTSAARADTILRRKEPRKPHERNDTPRVQSI